jgi:steroid 5-alpha reductase family enzyme
MMQHAYTVALFAILAVGVVSWLFSIVKKDVSFVDSLWSLFFLIAAVVFALDAQTLSARGQLVLLLVAVWSLRLSIYITVRNWGEPEDYRYQTIRSNNEPGFAFKSLYIVFGLQGLLAWFIALPLLPAITSSSALSWIDLVAAAIWTLGFIFSSRDSSAALTARVAHSIPVYGVIHATRTILANSACGGLSTCSLSPPVAGGASLLRF